jgi:hypothetical protein
MAVTRQDVEALFRGLCVGKQAQAGAITEADLYEPVQGPSQFDPALLSRAINDGSFYRSMR